MPILSEIQDVSYSLIGRPVILSVNAHDGVHVFNPLRILTLSIPLQVLCICEKLLVAKNQQRVGLNHLRWRSEDVKLTGLKI